MTIFSCNKETENLSDSGLCQNINKSIQPVIYDDVEYYYTDTVLTNFNNLVVDTTIDNYIQIVAEADANQKMSKIKIYEFSDKESYIKFGSEVNIDIEGLLDFEEAVHDYVIDNDIEALTEQNEKIPEDYLNFELSLYNGIFTENAKLLAGTTLHKNYWGGSPAHHMSFTMPVMWGWNNKVSATYPKYFYGAHTIYNKKWYRKRMATISGWGWMYYRFVGPLSWLNDRMSSGITT